ncbi:MAG: rRNA maturation RNase YbeY [Clostridiales bacterium]|nr:rRNA maturation RNase YbeY [Clostridiales bacterium]
MTINIEYESDIKLDLDYEDIITKVIDKSLELEKCPYEIELSVVLTDNDSIHEINKTYRNIDAPTDVLSFPMVDYDIPGDFSDLDEYINDYFNPETGELMLGDIIISVEKVIEQAKEYGHSRIRELAFLVAHSMLHLFGYDHMDDETSHIMEGKQENILSELNIRR